MSTLKFIIYAAGIGLSYLYFGIVQEDITYSRHGPQNLKFTYTKSLILFQCLFNTIFAKFILTYVMKQGYDNTKSSYYAMSALTYLTAMVSSNMALQHVNYPTQVVGKSCKPIPIMILGVLLGKKRHSLKKYLFVSMIVIGVVLFMYNKNKSISKLDPGSMANENQSYLAKLTASIGMGELLLLLSLTMDGLTGAVQERMKGEYHTKSGHMMYKMNLWSTFFLLAVTLISGELFECIDFIKQHNNLITKIALFSSLSAIGQLFIFLTVSEFGPLPCSIITTTRKFFTVLASVFLFGNKLTSNQWIGTTFVFTGLTLDAISIDKSKTNVDKKLKESGKQKIN